MEMRMGHALADDVVQRDEAAFRLQSGHHGAGDELDARAERGHDRIGHIGKRFIMRQRHEQHMPEYQRPVIQESCAYIVAVDTEAWFRSADDRAEFAGLWELIYRACLSAGHQVLPKSCTSSTASR